jgi:hypothetical protein
MTKIDVQFVPYQGPASPRTDGGRIEFSISNSVVAPLIASGKLRARDHGTPECRCT